MVLKPKVSERFMEDNYFSSYTTAIFTQGIALLMYLQYQYQIRAMPIKMILNDLVQYKSGYVKGFGFKKKLLLDTINKMEQNGLLSIALPTAEADKRVKYLKNLSPTQLRSLDDNKIAYIYQMTIGLIRVYYQQLEFNERKLFMNLMSSRVFWEVIKDLSDSIITDTTNLESLKLNKINNIWILGIDQDIKTMISYFIEFYDNFCKIINIILEKDNI